MFLCFLKKKEKKKSWCNKQEVDLTKKHYGRKVGTWHNVSIP